jgi:hypothetical protein
MKCLFACSAALIAFANLCPALICQSDKSTWKQWVDQGEPYSLAVCDGRDPQAAFDQEKSKLDKVASTPSLLPTFLVHTAMAALEAGRPDEAKFYAERALDISKASHVRPVSFEAESESVANSLANVVLGRLALQRGDTAGAEQRLVSSAEVDAGFVRFWGPNMTLARELLKQHRCEGVLNFLDRASLSWREPGAAKQLRVWRAAISDGKIPDFGANLLYR